MAKRKSTAKSRLIETVFAIAKPEKLTDISSSRDEDPKTGEIYTESAITVKFEGHSCIFGITQNNKTGLYHAVRYDKTERENYVVWRAAWGIDYNQFFDGTPEQLAEWVKSVWDETSQSNAAIGDGIAGVGDKWFGPKDLNEPSIMCGINQRKLYSPEQIKSMYIK